MKLPMNCGWLRHGMITMPTLNGFTKFSGLPASGAAVSTLAVELASMLPASRLVQLLPAALQLSYTVLVTCSRLAAGWLAWSKMPKSHSLT